MPFAAVKVFFDPSVPYGLQFDEAGGTRDTGSVVGINEDTGIGPDGPTGLPPGIGVPAIARDGGRASTRAPAGERAERKRPARRVRNDKDEDGDAIGENVVDGAHNRRAEPQPVTRVPPVLAPVPSTLDNEAHATPGPDNVISLDRFRKKP